MFKTSQWWIQLIPGPFCQCSDGAPGRAKNKGCGKECLWWYISICYTNMIFKKYKNWKITTIVNILNIISKSKSYAAIVTVVYDIRYADNTRIARNDSYSVNANNLIYSINGNRMRCLIIHFFCNLLTSGVLLFGLFWSL